MIKKITTEPLNECENIEYFLSNGDKESFPFPQLLLSTGSSHRLQNKQTKKYKTIRLERHNVKALVN